MNTYLEEFYNLNCHIDVLQVFNNYKKIKNIHKEITESYSCYKCLVDVLKIDDQSKTKVYVVGDGKYPRTGSMLSFRTKWDIESIDPEANVEWFKIWTDYKARLNQNVFRLQIHKSTIEEAKIEKSDGFDNFVVVMPHSHATIKSTLTALAKVYGPDQKFTLVNMPCCISVPSGVQTLEFVKNNGFFVYSDNKVMSPKNMFYCWKNICLNDMVKK